MGVVVRRKWTGFEGRGGLRPRDEECAGVSTLKFLIRSVTRPRPAQVGAVNDFPASAESALRNLSNAPISLPARESWAFWGSLEHRLPLVVDADAESNWTVLDDGTEAASPRFPRPDLVLTEPGVGFAEAVLALTELPLVGGLEHTGVWERDFNSVGLDAFSWSGRGRKVLVSSRLSFKFMETSGCIF